MPDEQLLKLQGTLVADYASLVKRLALVLRSHDKARDAVHDAYLKLSSRPAIGEVRNPLAYLYRMTLNLARNVATREARSVCATREIIQSIPDEAPDPERIVSGHHDVEVLLQILAVIPERRRNIFLARWRDEYTHSDIAAQFGLHKRTVQKELRKVELLLRKATVTFD